VVGRGISIRVPGEESDVLACTGCIGFAKDGPNGAFGVVGQEVSVDAERAEGRDGAVVVAERVGGGATEEVARLTGGRAEHVY
jgi:hypothetical protein